MSFFFGKAEQTDGTTTTTTTSCVSGKVLAFRNPNPKTYRPSEWCPIGFIVIGWHADGMVVVVVPKVELLLLIHNDDHYLGLCINNYVYFSTDEGVAGGRGDRR